MCMSFVRPISWNTRQGHLREEKLLRQPVVMPVAVQQMQKHSQGTRLRDTNVRCERPARHVRSCAARLSPSRQVSFPRWARSDAWGWH